MSDASDRLERTRAAIIEQIEGRARKKDPRTPKVERELAKQAERDHAQTAEQQPRAASPKPSGGKKPLHRDFAGWFGAARRAARTWWRHHPARLGVEIATPMLSSYAQRKPLQYLGIAAAVGAVIAVARPWRLISATGVVMALVKSSQLSGLLMSALSAANFGKDDDPS